MKRNIIIFAALAMLVMGGCAESSSVREKDLAVEYFEKWVKKNYPDAEETPLGAYILHISRSGSGVPLGNTDETKYIRADYFIRDFSGKYLGTTYEFTAKQLGDWSKSCYFGARVISREGNPAGLEETLETMEVGDSVVIAIPGWLQTSKKLSSREKYLDLEFSSSPEIFSVKVTEAISDIEKWEKDSVDRYVRRLFPSVELNDSSYYFILNDKGDAPDSTYEDDDKIYLNYSGRLLNGNLFDTTVREDAYDAGTPYMRSSYAPTYITWSGSPEEITLGSDETKVIPGFYLALSKMKPHQKATVIFPSSYGYGASTMGESAKGFFHSIPAYSPIRFDIEFTDSPEDGNE